MCIFLKEQTLWWAVNLGCLKKMWTLIIKLIIYCLGRKIEIAHELFETTNLFCLLLKINCYVMWLNTRSKNMETSSKVKPVFPPRMTFFPTCSQTVDIIYWKQSKDTQSKCLYIKISLKISSSTYFSLFSSIMLQQKKHFTVRSRINWNKSGVQSV